MEWWAWFNNHENIKVWMLLPFVFLSIAKLAIIFWLIVKVVKYTQKVDQMELGIYQRSIETAVEVILDRMEERRDVSDSV